MEPGEINPVQHDVDPIGSYSDVSDMSDDELGHGHRAVGSARGR
jgi:hypothetical protein